MVTSFHESNMVPCGVTICHWHCEIKQSSFITQVSTKAKHDFLLPIIPTQLIFYLASLFLQQVFLFFTLLFFTAQHSTETNLYPATWALAPKARGASCTNSSYKWNVQLKGAHWEWVPGWPQTKNGTSPLCYLFILLGMKHFTLQIRWYSAVTLYTHVQQ